MSIFDEPDYSHLQLKERDLTITLTRAEQEAVLKAYDYGIETADIDVLNKVISHLKDEIHP